MERNVRRIWVALLVVALGIVIVIQGDSLTPIDVAAGEGPFLTALVQLGILYVVALFVERSLEVLIKAWRQGGKTGSRRRRAPRKTVAGRRSRASCRNTGRAPRSGRFLAA